MKHEIERTLQEILSEPLTGMWRYVGFQRFEFGEQRPRVNRKGQEFTRADKALIVNVDWRITSDDGLEISTADFPSGDVDEESPAVQFVDRLLNAAPVVRSVQADEDGGLRISLSDGYELFVDPAAYHDAEDPEYWRYMPEDPNQRHFVVTRDGIEE